MRDTDKQLPEQFNEMYSAWVLGEENRYLPKLRGVAPQGSGADYHYAKETLFFNGIERARAFEREDCVVGQAVRRLVNTVLREPTTVDPDTGDEGADKAILEAFNDWGNDRYQVDARGLSTFSRMSKQVLRSVIRDGDIGVNPLQDGSLQALEAHRIRTPQNSSRNVVHGVLLDEITAKPLEYWVARETPDPYKPVKRVKDLMHKIRARDEDGFPNFFHVYNPTRVSQTRGISAFLPVTYITGIHNDLQFAMLVKAQAAAFFALFFEMGPDVVAASMPAQLGSRTDERQPDGSTRTFEKLTPGAVVRGRPGEKMQGFAPNIPNPEFFPHTMMLLSIIAVNLDMPGMMLILDPSKTNFSGWRGAIDQAKGSWIDLQQMLLEMWFEPVYQWKLRQIVAADSGLQKTGRSSTVRLQKHVWRPCRWPYIEPLKDAEAEAKRLDTGLASPRQIAAEKGRDYDEMVKEITADNRRLIEAAIADAAAINEKNPEAGITWKDLMPCRLREKLLAAAPPSKSMGDDDELDEDEDRPQKTAARAA